MMDSSPQKIESFGVLFTFAKGIFRDGWKLYRTNFYKMTEFQLLFKIIYFSIIFWGISYAISAMIDFFSRAANNVSLSQLLQKFDILSAFHISSVFLLVIWAAVILFIYFIERTGITYMSERYYKNKPVSFFRTLRRALQRTPKVIVAKVYERRIPLFIVITLYVIQSFLSVFGAPTTLTSFFSTLLTIGIVLFLLTLIFLNGFTVHVACLNRKESAYHFKKKLSWSFNQRRYFTLTLFYAGVTVIMLLIITAYWTLIKSLMVITENSAPLLSFFIAFTFFLILVFWSLIKSLRIDLTTVLYMQARKELHLTIPQIAPTPDHHRRHSQKPLTGFLLLSIFVIIMTVITMKPVESGMINIYEFAQSVMAYNEAIEVRDQQLFDKLLSLLPIAFEWLEELFE